MNFENPTEIPLSLNFGGIPRYSSSKEHYEILLYMKIQEFPAILVKKQTV